MKISTKAWVEYINKLSKISRKAADQMTSYIQKNGFEDTKAILDLAYGLSSKYGTAASTLACAMYDKTARAQGADVPDAEPVPNPDYGEVAKAVNGAKKQSEKLVPSAVGRLVKQQAADTTLTNARRDGAQFAWIPNGDTCAFCIAIASRGWQYMSAQALKGGHAEHIHANCDCEYAIRFDNHSTVAGYGNGEQYREMYDNAEGGSSKDKINALRRGIYAEKKAHGSEPDFYTGENGKTLLAAYKEWIGDNKMQETLNSCESEEAKAVIRTDFRKTSFVGNGDTSSIRQFEIATGLKCGRNGGDHAQKVQDLIRQIERTLLKDIPENDKLILKQRLEELRRVSEDGIQ